jgi:hypothetical protein
MGLAYYYKYDVAIYILHLISIAYLVDIEILENWLSTGKCMSHEEAKHFPNLEQELQVIREQIIALKEDKVELPGTVNYLPGHMKYILGSRYNFSDEEQEQIVSNMYTFRRTSSQIEKMCQLIESDLLITKEKIIEITSEGLVNLSSI